MGWNAPAQQYSGRCASSAVYYEAIIIYRYETRIHVMYALVVVCALLAPKDHPRDTVVPIEYAPPGEHGERRAVRAHETEAVRLDDGVDDEWVPASNKTSVSILPTKTNVCDS